MDITFTNPPDKRLAYDYDKLREELESRPNLWARCDPKPMRMSVINSIKQGSNTRLTPLHGIEVTVREVHYNGEGTRVAEGFFRYNPHKDTRLTKKEADKIAATGRREKN